VVTEPIPFNQGLTFGQDSPCYSVTRWSFARKAKGVADTQAVRFASKAPTANGGAIRNRPAADIPDHPGGTGQKAQ